MTTLPDLRFAVVTDLHIGSTTANRWHNQFLTDEPQDTLAMAVAAINAERPDFVLVAGDLSDTATPAELQLARQKLDRLEADWIVARGNHDQLEDGDRSAFMDVFGDRTAVGFVTEDQIPLPAGVRLLSLDAEWDWSDGLRPARLPDSELDTALRWLQDDPPALLLVLTHIPFLDQAAAIAERDPNGLNAGTLLDGDAAFARLTSGPWVTIAVHGHQHFHHVVVTGRSMHATTASLAEYPAEFRLFTIAGGVVETHVVPFAPDLIGGAMLETIWVHGRPQDRRLEWTPEGE